VHGELCRGELCVVNCARCIVCDEFCRGELCTVNCAGGELWAVNCVRLIVRDELCVVNCRRTESKTNVFLQIYALIPEFKFRT
jgi:hypothetical protein